MAKRGRPKKKDPSVIAADDLLQWSRNVIRVAQNPYATDDEDDAIRFLREWLEEDAANKKTFFSMLLPKATDALAKHSVPEEDERIIQEEKRKISELQTAFRELVQEAKDLAAKSFRTA